MGSKFESSIKEIGCRRFEGANESQRIHEIFHYMDRGGDGSISESEWMLLDILASEIRLGIHEFMQFLGRSFPNDFQAAWGLFSEVDSRGIDEQDWCARSREAGYFGPAKITFRMLDESKRGKVFYSDFLRLPEHYR